MKLFLILLSFWFPVACVQNDTEPYNSCFLRLSNGISVLLSCKDVQNGSKDIINSITDLAAFIVKDNHLTQEEAHEIATALVDFKVELEKLIIYSERATQSVGEAAPDEKEKQLLVDGLNQVIYHVFMLAVFKSDVAYHIRHIVSGILKLISYVLENKQSGNHSIDPIDLSQINAELEDSVNKKILSFAFKPLN